MSKLSPDARIVALDLETTGLSARRDRVVELAAVCWQHGIEVGHFQTLVNPGCRIPERVTRIHGITDAMVADKPYVLDVLPAFLDFCRADYVVAHNAPFDHKFLRAECERWELYMPHLQFHDTCRLAREVLPGCPNYRLETLKIVLGIGKGQAHRALEDARDCLAIFLNCMKVNIPPLLLPVAPPPLPEALSPLREAMEIGGTLFIEYQDARGGVTLREIRPLMISGEVIEAHCLLRNDKRHFSLERIRRMWRD